MLMTMFVASPTFALKGFSIDNNNPHLNHQQSFLFRRWFTAIIRQQAKQGPSARWKHRDCAGLIRFAIYETFREHDEKWLKASGFERKNLPEEIELTKEQKQIRNNWKTSSGEIGAYARAADMVYHNSIYLGKNYHQIKSGDLVFYDQGDNQHLMVWLGDIIIYHTGTVTSKDNGLRVITINDLLTWKDTRWRITPQNPNFIGFYQLGFLSA